MVGGVRFRLKALILIRGRCWFVELIVDVDFSKYIFFKFYDIFYVHFYRLFYEVIKVRRCYEKEFKVSLFNVLRSQISNAIQFI